MKTEFFSNCEMVPGSSWDQQTGVPALLRIPDNTAPQPCESSSSDTCSRVWWWNTGCLRAVPVSGIAVVGHDWMGWCHGDLGTVPSCVWERWVLAQNNWSLVFACHVASIRKKKNWLVIIPGVLRPGNYKEFHCSYNFEAPNVSFIEMFHWSQETALAPTLL